MSRPRPALVELTIGEYDELVDQMAPLSADGTGWVNLRPIIEAEHQPDPPGPFAIFGNSAHKVPTATWMPGARNADGTAKRDTVGLQHSTGPRLARRLGDLGMPLPDGWKVTQDHARRGLVATLPAGESNQMTVDWLMRVATMVCAVPVSGRWLASVHATRR